MTQKAYEREMLIRLAPVWLACRWKLMGHEMVGWPHGSDMAFDMLGCMDYRAEMRLVSAQRRRELETR